ncbi:MAG: rhamnulokinase [Bacteroidaceae bacterium]|nr:rhamnulokinase [Bacteroidaceae bacterium]
MKHFLSVDLGATSGRTVLASYADGRVEMEEWTRFANPQLPRDGHLYWDLAHLHAEIVKALTRTAEQHIPLTSIGIDTWGVDFAFFGADGRPMGDPYCYRDPQTDGAVERYFQTALPARQLYQRTGIQFMPFNSLFQLDTLRRRGVALADVSRVLFMPDALSFLLTGEAVCEYTIASTSQLLNPATGDLDEELLATVGMRREQFGRLVHPGERVGVLTEELQRQTGCGPVPVVAVGGHDTASAVAAVPAQDRDYAYLSCGTWSLLGIESRHAIINDASFRHNFTNEGGLDGTTRFLKNICGLWLFENCRREFTDVPADIMALTGLCRESDCPSLIVPDATDFAHPESMCTAIRLFCERTGQPAPATAADFIRVIYRSLACRYRQVLALLAGFADFPIRRLHVIGGGSKNPFLMQMTADCTGLPVVAGPTEGTALGNALVQVRAAGDVGSLEAMRGIVSRSVEVRRYQPGDTAAWDEAYERFCAVAAKCETN